MLRNLKASSIRLASTALDLTGLLSTISHLRLHNRCVVLTYHRVIKDSDRLNSSSHPGIIVSSNNFEMQMKFVAEYFSPMTLDSFERHLLDGKSFPPRSCLITFDDGWLDNYDVAFPILKAYGIPATIFLPVDYISNDKLFWQEELVMRLRAQHDIEGPRPGRAADIRNLVSRLKQESSDEIDRALSAARSDTAHLSFSGHYDRYLTWTQVAKMQENGISFGSHACSHRILCKLSDDEQIRELTASKAVLEERLGRQVNALAYPNGDFDKNVVKNAKTAGYTIAFSTNSGLKHAKATGYSMAFSRSHRFCETASDKFAIPRMNVHDYNAPTAAMFKCTLLGLI